SITGPPPTGTNVCVAGQMVLQLDGSAGQQLFICNACLDGWNAFNDDAATVSRRLTYRSQQVAAEATARQAADSTETSRATTAERSEERRVGKEGRRRRKAEPTETTNRAAADSAE